VPVLEDGDIVIADSNAIMVYLAKKTGATNWLPETPEGAARVQRWLSVAAGQIAFGPGVARLVTLFGAAFNPDEVIERAHAILGLIEDHLKTQSWLASDHPTIADIALYSYVARAPEGNVDLSSYGKVQDWLLRIEALPGFVPFMHAPAELLASACFFAPIPRVTKPRASNKKTSDHARSHRHPNSNRLSPVKACTSVRASPNALARRRNSSSANFGCRCPHGPSRRQGYPRSPDRTAPIVLRAIAICRTWHG